MVMRNCSLKNRSWRQRTRNLARKRVGNENCESWTNQYVSMQSVDLKWAGWERTNSSLLGKWKIIGKCIKWGTAKVWWHARHSPRFGESFGWYIRDFSFAFPSVAVFDFWLLCTKRFRYNICFMNSLYLLYGLTLLPKICPTVLLCLSCCFQMRFVHYSLSLRRCAFILNMDPKDH